MYPGSVRLTESWRVRVMESARAESRAGRDENAVRSALHPRTAVLLNRTLLTTTNTAVRCISTESGESGSRIWDGATRGRHLVQDAGHAS